MPDRDWSPADSPHAVALSEANAWKRAIDLCADRMHAGSPDAQTDARLFLLALRLLLRARQMASNAVKSVPGAARFADDAWQQFEQACPQVKDACDRIEHFADYAVGRGNRQPGGSLPQSKQPTDRVAAAEDWALRYDQSADRIMLGPIEIDVVTVSWVPQLIGFLVRVPG